MLRLMAHVLLVLVLTRSVRVVTIAVNATSALLDFLSVKMPVSSVWKIVMSARIKIVVLLALQVSSGTVTRPPLNAVVALMCCLSVPSALQPPLAPNARQIQSSWLTRPVNFAAK